MLIHYFPTRGASEGIHSAFLLDNEDQTILSFSPNYDYRCLELDAGSPELFVFSLLKYFSHFSWDLSRIVEYKPMLSCSEAVVVAASFSLILPCSLFCSSSFSL